LICKSRPAWTASCRFGTTGESPTVDYEEHLDIIALTVKLAAHKVKVLAGTGGNSTSEAV